MTHIEAPSVTRPRIPRPVRVAVGSVLAGVVLHVVNLIVRLVDPVSPAAVARRMRHAGLPAASGHALGGAATTGTTIAVVSTVVICGVGLFLALRMRAGANWARITLTVFAVLEVVSAIVTVLFQSALGLPTGGGPVAVVVEIAIALASVTFLVTAFRAPATAFFATAGGGRDSR